MNLQRIWFGETFDTKIGLKKIQKVKFKNSIK